MEPPILSDKTLDELLQVEAYMTEQFERLAQNPAEVDNIPEDHIHHWVTMMMKKMPNFVGVGGKFNYHILILILATIFRTCGNEDEARRIENYITQ